LYNQIIDFLANNAIGALCSHLTTLILAIRHYKTRFL